MDWSLTLSAMAWSLLGVAAINVVFDYWYDAVRVRTAIWLPRDVTVEDLADVANWRAEQRGEAMAAD